MRELRGTDVERDRPGALLLRRSACAPNTPPEYGFMDEYSISGALESVDTSLSRSIVFECLNQTRDIDSILYFTLKSK